MHEPVITVVGNIGAPPRSRVLASGAVVTDFRIAATPRRVDRATGQWSDGETIWFGVSCWRQLAENVAACVRTGDRVVVTGHLRSSTWTTDQGEQRSRLEVDAQTVAFDLSRGRAVQERTGPLAPPADAGPSGDPDDVAPDGTPPEGLAEGLPGGLTGEVPAQAGAA